MILFLGLCSLCGSSCSHGVQNLCCSLSRSNHLNSSVNLGDKNDHNNSSSNSTSRRKRNSCFCNRGHTIEGNNSSIILSYLIFRCFPSYVIL